MDDNKSKPRDAAPATRTIKRYANRKLYDTANSCYITLEEIARLVQAGEEVRIIDNRTKEDLTSVTLAQILFEEEKRQKKMLPLNTLKNVIQSGGVFFQRTITEPLREEAEKVTRPVRDFVDNTQRSIDELQRRIDERVRAVIQTMTPTNMREYFELLQQVERLHQRLEAVEEKLARLLGESTLPD
ncbi:MAG: transcriptional regulator [Myxococcales bacterium]|nr:transcriptional regulator [Myxococcales bacterium]